MGAKIEPRSFIDANTDKENFEAIGGEGSYSEMLAHVRAKMAEQYGEEDGHVTIVDGMIKKNKEYAASDYVGYSNEHMYRLLAKRGLAQRVQGKNIYDVIEDRYDAVFKGGVQTDNTNPKQGH